MSDKNADLGTDAAEALRRFGTTLLKAKRQYIEQRMNVGVSAERAEYEWNHEKIGSRARP